jgi:ABC-2 type transport system permease protein
METGHEPGTSAAGAQETGNGVGLPGVEKGVPASLSPDDLSPIRAWFYLVWLSWQRLARARQMVWMALGLLAIALLMVVVTTAQGRWGMHHWRMKGRGPSYEQWTEEVQTLMAATSNSTVLSLQAAVMGTCRAVLYQSGFYVFARWIIFSALLGFLLPMWSLGFATDALGSERENRSLVWLLMRPLPRPAIYLGKFVALLPWALGLNLGGFAVLCLAGGAPGRLALHLFWPAILCGSLAFCALFYLMGAYFRRPAVAGLVYVFFLEIVFGNLPGFLKRVSITFYARCMLYAEAQDYGYTPDNPEIFMPVNGSTAIAVLLMVTVLLLALGTVVFTRSQYHEAT